MTRLERIQTALRLLGYKQDTVHIGKWSHKSGVAANANNWSVVGTTGVSLHIGDGISVYLNWPSTNAKDVATLLTATEEFAKALAKVNSMADSTELEGGEL